MARRGLRGLFLHTKLLFGGQTSSAAPQRSKLFTAKHGSFCSFSAYHMYGGMSQTTMLAFRTLNLLKSSHFESGIAASVHCLSLKANALFDLAARTSLLTAYARAQDLGSALALFDETAARDVILWNAMISAFVLNSHFRSSILLFQEMAEIFCEFDSTTLLIMLSAFSRTNRLKYGTILHGVVVKRNFSSDRNLCNALIDMYSKCGCMNLSDLIFEEMEIKDATSWNCMISGSTYNGCSEGSLCYFLEMRRTNVRADAVSLSSIITACSLVEELLGYGESVHSLVIKMGYETYCSSSLSNSLISFYFRYEKVKSAEAVFRNLVNRNVVSWNVMIRGLLDYGNLMEALNHFREMQSKPMIEPDDTTLVTLVPACGEFHLLSEGKSIHGFAIRRGIDPLNSSVENALLDMYFECGDLKSADLLFRKMPDKDIISWNTMISQFSQNNFKEEARLLFHELLQSGTRCSMVTLISILPSCNCSEDISFGKALHGCLIRYGFSNSVSALNALMLMYINCGDLNASTSLFDSISSLSDIISWNTMIVGCVHNKQYKDALKFFASMRSLLHLKPDSITLVSALSACGNLELSLYGQCLHGLALKGQMDFDLRVKNALLTMYFRCNDPKSAEAMFKMDATTRNLCSWNCMISGFAHNQEGKKSLEYFQNMGSLVPNEFSIVGILIAFTQSGDIRYGKEVHGYICRFYLQNNAFISSALVDMYSKCGRLDVATQVFENTEEKSVACWNSMIAAYGMHSQGRKSIEHFSRMCNSGVKSTKSTFISLLSACSHCGLVDEGLKYFNLMAEEYGVQPSIEHEVYVIDMLGRAGRLEEAFDFIEKSPEKAEAGVWGALLSACRNHGDVTIGKMVAEKLFCSEPENTGYYVTLSNLFAYHELWNEAVKTRGMLLERGLSKPPGCSFVDIIGSY